MKWGGIMTKAILRFIRETEEKHRAAQTIIQAFAVPSESASPLIQVVDPNEMKRPDTQTSVPNTPSISLEKRTVANATEAISLAGNSSKEPFASGSLAKSESSAISTRKKFETSVDGKVFPSINAPKEQPAAKPTCQDK
jgi:hypothetical protein